MSLSYALVLLTWRMLDLFLYLCPALVVYLIGPFWQCPGLLFLIRMYPRYVPLLHCFSYLICMCTYCVLIQLYCNKIWGCPRLTLYRHSFLLLYTFLVPLHSALSTNSSHLITLQSRYVSTVPRHSSYLRERSFPFPVDISPCTALSAVVSQLCPPRDRL